MNINLTKFNSYNLFKKLRPDLDLQQPSTIVESELQLKNELLDKEKEILELKIKLKKVMFSNLCNLQK